MSDFTFLQNILNGEWVVSAPRRSHRTNVSKDASVCPFCPGQEVAEEEVYRVEVSNEPKETSPVGTDTKVLGTSGSFVSSDLSSTSNWSIRVIKNKFPFAPHHELIIHSPDHHKNWDELPFSQVELILKTYRQRFVAHKKAGQVYLFHNRGHAAGESIPHPHTQLVVMPHKIKLNISPLDPNIYNRFKNPKSETRNPKQNQNTKIQSTKRFENSNLENSDIVSNLDIRASDLLETEHFYIFCPTTSEWPDEVWVAPKHNGGGFGFIKDGEITDLGFVLSRLIQIFDLRHGHEFAFNFYIAPLKNWYLRLIPRKKILGGFELGTHIMVNTQDSKETFGFIREHFWMPDRERIKSHQYAKYRANV